MKPEYYDCFWKGLETGEYPLPTQEDLEAYVKGTLLAGEPLVPISEEDKTWLVQNITYMKYFEQPHLRYKSIIQSPCYFFPNGTPSNLREANLQMEKSRPSLVVLQTEPFQDSDHERFTAERGKESFARMMELDHVPLTAEEKKNIFSDPRMWNEIRLIEPGCATNLHSQGMRPLDHYFPGGDQLFFEMYKQVSERQGRNDLDVLDIGGANGVALTDIKESLPESRTHNLTLEVEPCMLPVDNLYNRAAEFMPKELAESIDIAISNFAWAYFCMPDRAIEGTLRALRPGGEARLDLCTGKAYPAHPELGLRMQAQWQRLATLREEGYVDFTHGFADAFGDPLTHIPTKDPESGQYLEFPPASLYLTKLKSLED